MLRSVSGVLQAAYEEHPEVFAGQEDKLKQLASDVQQVLTEGEPNQNEPQTNDQPAA